MSIHSIKIHPSMTSRVHVLYRHDEVILRGTADCECTHVRLVSGAVSLGPLATVRGEHENFEWFAEIPAKWLLNSHGVNSWHVEIAVAPHTTEATIEQDVFVRAYREPPADLRWTPAGVISVVSATRSVLSLLASAPAMMIGVGALAVAATDRRLLSRFIVAMVCAIVLCGTSAMMCRLIFRHSIRWWKYSVLVGVLLSLAATGLAHSIAQRARTVRINAIAAPVSARFGDVGTDRLMLDFELDAWRPALLTQGVSVVALSQASACEQSQLRSAHRQIATALVCTHRWLSMIPQVRSELGLTNFTHVAPWDCIDLTGPRCVAGLGTPSGPAPGHEPKLHVSQVSSDYESEEDGRWSPSTTQTVSFRALPSSAQFHRLRNTHVSTWGDFQLTRVRLDQSDMTTEWVVSAAPRPVTQTSMSLSWLTASPGRFTFYAGEEQFSLPSGSPDDLENIATFVVDGTLFESIGTAEGAPTRLLAGRHRIALSYRYDDDGARLVLRLRRRSSPNLLRDPQTIAALEELVLPPMVTTVEVIAPNVSRDEPEPALSANIYCSTNYSGSWGRIHALDTHDIPRQPNNSAVRFYSTDVLELEPTGEHFTVDLRSSFLCASDSQFQIMRPYRYAIIEEDGASISRREWRIATSAGRQLLLRRAR